MANVAPDFRTEDWLRKHIRDIQSFYFPACIDSTRGGYFHQFSDLDGTLYERDLKHLVGTCRYIYNFSVEALLDGPAHAEDAAAHGVDFLMDAHLDNEYGGFTWVLNGRDVHDGRKYCYGHSFAVLALAKAAQAGVVEAEEHLMAVLEMVDNHFWEEEHGLCRIEATQDWSFTPYRGQNANMHMCEALLTAYEATGDTAHIERAAGIAETLARRLPARGDGLIWEHYTETWDHDWTYNETNIANFFRPWGFLPGHQLEWAKLLMLLDNEHPDTWFVDQATKLFNRSMAVAWDDNGGICYSFDRNDRIIIDDKFYWVMAEAIAASALLAEHTGESRFWTWYDRLWTYVWDNFVNHETGLWYRLLDSTHTPDPEMNKTPRVKTDYHTVSACYETIRVLTE